MDDQGTRPQEQRTHPGQSGFGPGAFAADSTPVELILQDPGGWEADIVHQAIPASSRILELGCGVGRLTLPLREFGHTVVAVDESEDMLGHVPAPTVLDSIEDLDLKGRQFDVVLLAGRLVNLVPRSMRRRFLDTCARHVRPGGSVIVQFADMQMYEAAPFERKNGSRTFGVRDVQHVDDERLTATLVSEVGDRRWIQNVTLWKFDQDDFAQMLAVAGLRRSHYLDSEGLWLLATKTIEGQHS